MARPADSAGNPWRRTRRSFRFAFAGMAHMIRSQPNARIHLVIAAVACGLAVWLRLPPLAWALLAAMIGLVLAPDKVTYRVRVGDYLGQADGRATAVHEDRIELVELVPDGAGGWLERPATVALEDQ